MNSGIPSPSSSGEPSQAFFCCLPPTRASSSDASFFIRCEVILPSQSLLLRKALLLWPSCANYLCKRCTFGIDIGYRHG
ncbi:hypothetical protein LXL04_007531 [Taraxacum kok-saghyz]